MTGSEGRRQERALALVLTAFQAASMLAAAAQIPRTEQERFLSTASIVQDPGPAAEATGLRRVTLEDGTRRHDASVVTEDGSGPTRRDHRFNVAAFELDKAIGLSLVVPTVARVVSGRPASLSWWIDDVAMSEVVRRRKGIEPPDQDSWTKQVQAVRIFDELIANAYRDPNPPLYLNSIWDNLLITRDWTVWLIDHTGAFGIRQDLKDRDSLMRCPRRVLARLRALDRASLEQLLGAYLSAPPLHALDARRALLVRHFSERIDSHGEGAVLYDLPPRP